MSGMIKFTSPSGWDFGTKIASSLKISSRGLIGNDRQDFLKQASASFAKDLDNIKFAKDEYPLHLIALGASEAYSCNRNGDGFKEATCKKYHDTFTKFAKFFRNHKNKPERGDPYYGTVKASAYNDEMRRVELICGLNMNKEAADRTGGLVADTEVEKLAKGEDLPVSMACVLNPDYPVLTKDNGYKAIKDIKVGDYVWTKEGRWRKVYKLNRRQYSGKVYTFKVNGLPLPLTLTADHPMFATKFTRKYANADIGHKATRYFSDPKAFESNKPSWLHAEHLQAGDRFFYSPVTHYPGYAALADVTLAKLLGYYTAEGSLEYNADNPCTVSYSCHVTDVLPQVVPKLIHAIDETTTVEVKPARNSNFALVVKVFNTKFANICSKYVGSHVKSKHITPELFNASPEIKLAFLGCWIDGDGWVDKKGIHISTCNLHLALQARDLLASIGIPTSLYRINHKDCATSGYENSGMEYTVNISHLEGERLESFSTKVKASSFKTTITRGKPACMRSCFNKLYAYRIKSVVESEVTDVTTYNFEVEEDESYSLGGFISHNCHIPYDVCSYCGNQARTRDEYCTQEKCAAGGCRDNLARLVKVAGDLHHLHVDNPTPRWFDISRVFRPADRIAYGSRADYLTKAASDESVFDIQEYIKFASEATAPLSVILYNSGEHGFWKESHVGLIKLANALSMYRVSSTGPEYLCLPTKYFPVEKLASFGSTECNRQLAALADQKIILSLTDFANLVGKSDLIKMASSMLPDIYSRKIQDESLLVAIEKGACDFIDAVPTHKDRLLATTHRNDFSLDYKIAQDRLYSNCLRSHNVTPAVTMKTAAYDVKAESLATQYALYKLAALWRIAENDTEFPLTTKLSIYQNQIFV